MKKLGILLLCILLLCGCLPTAADEPAQVTTTASATTLRRGDTVTLTVAVAGSPNVTTVAIKIGDAFDSNVFSYQSAKWLINGFMLTDVDEKKLNAVAGGAAEKSINSSIFEFVLKVKDTAPIGKTTIDTEVVAKKKDNAFVSFSTTVCEIQVVCDHIWKAADCIAPKTCSLCKTTEGAALGHDYQNNTCVRCGMAEAGTTAPTTLPTQGGSSMMGQINSTTSGTASTTVSSAMGTSGSMTVPSGSNSTTGGQTASPSLPIPTRTTIGCAPGPFPTFVFPTVGTSAGQFTPTTTTTTTAPVEGIAPTMSGPVTGDTVVTTTTTLPAPTTAGQSTGIAVDSTTLGNSTTTVAIGSSSAVPSDQPSGQPETSLSRPTESRPVQDAVTTPVPKENNHIGVFILLCVVVVLGVGGAVVGVLYRKKK